MRAVRNKKASSSQSKLNKFASDLLEDENSTPINFSVETPIFQSPQKIRQQFKKKSILYKTSSEDHVEINEKSENSHLKIASNHGGNWKYIVASAGNNIFGQRDIQASFGDLSTKFTICQVPDSKGIEKISAGYNLSCSIGEKQEIQHISGKDNKSNNDAYLWGSGISGMQSKLYTSLISLSQIRYISCGQNHIACINNICEVYTWGTDEYGCLGHGNNTLKKGTITTIKKPKQVDFFHGISVINVSCGGYHTAFIGLANTDTLYGDVYTCGQGKGGQLGLGEDILVCSIPTKIESFYNLGYKASKVSCGLHHTIVLTMCIYETNTHTNNNSNNHNNNYSRTRQHHVFTFGFGEFGRLGLGDESPRLSPVEVLFEQNMSSNITSSTTDRKHSLFNPIYIGAGESHSIVCSTDICYSWGNNEHCQLGCGAPPSSMEMSVVPIRVAISEDLQIARLSVGSRHNGIITQCGKLLTWGWNEEGQCGHGTEKNAYFPRPCKLPRVMSADVTPIDISFGLTHSLLLLKNDRYIPEPILTKVVESTMQKLESPVEGQINNDANLLDTTLLVNDILDIIINDEINILLHRIVQQQQQEWYMYLCNILFYALIDYDLYDIADEAINDIVQENRILKMSILSTNKAIELLPSTIQHCGDERLEVDVFGPDIPPPRAISPVFFLTEQQEQQEVEEFTNKQLFQSVSPQRRVLKKQQSSDVLSVRSLSTEKKLPFKVPARKKSL